MGTSTTATVAPPARAEIRKRQNRDSARRSREKRKSHLRDVAESVELQSRRVRELDARVAQLEALVHRAVRPRAKRASTRAKQQQQQQPSSSSASAAAVSAPPPPPPQQPPQQQQQQAPPPAPLPFVQQLQPQQSQHILLKQQQHQGCAGPLPHVDPLVSLSSTDTAFPSASTPTFTTANTPTSALSFAMVEPWSSPIEALDPIPPDPAIVSTSPLDPYVIGGGEV